MDDFWEKRHRKEYYVTRFSSDLFYVSYKPRVCAIQTEPGSRMRRGGGMAKGVAYTKQNEA